VPGFFTLFLKLHELGLEFEEFGLVLLLLSLVFFVGILITSRQFVRICVCYGFSSVVEASATLGGH
jgi:hypothetical protein